MHCFRQRKSHHITDPNNDTSDVKTNCLLDVFQINDVASISLPSHGGLEGALTLFHQARYTWKRVEGIQANLEHVWATPLIQLGNNQQKFRTFEQKNSYTKRTLTPSRFPKQTKHICHLYSTHVVLIDIATDLVSGS